MTTQTTLTIDLLVFCDPTRPSIATPFSEGDWTYAAAPTVIIRVPRRGDVPERKDAPKNVGKTIFDAQPNTNQWSSITDIPIPPISSDTDCENCGGTGQHACGKCNSLHECGPCKGTGKVPAKPRAVQFGKHLISHLLLAKLAALLPDVELSENASDSEVGAISFRFAGGEGRIAPLRP